MINAISQNQRSRRGKVGADVGAMVRKFEVSKNVAIPKVFGRESQNLCRTFCRHRGGTSHANAPRFGLLRDFGESVFCPDIVHGEGLLVAIGRKVVGKSHEVLLNQREDGLPIDGRVHREGECHRRSREVLAKEDEHRLVEHMDVAI